MKDKKIIKEGALSNGDEVFTRIYSFENFFVKNAEDIVTNEYHSIGNCVLISIKNKAYGLMFKPAGGDEKSLKSGLYLKCHLYSWPQSGLISGGRSFFCTTKNLGIALQENISLVK